MSRTHLVACTSVRAAFGYGVAHGFLALSQNKQWGERAPERERCLLDVHAPIGDRTGSS